MNYDFENFDEHKNNRSDDYDVFDDTYNSKSRQIQKRPQPNSKKRRRKGLKWKLIALYENKLARIGFVSLILIIIIWTIVSAVGNNKKIETTSNIETTVAPTTQATAYQIKGVPVIPQNDLTAACETYACTMLLQSYGFDIDEYQFVDNYLITKPVYYGADGNLYGPDMNSAYAGDVYTGYGINAHGMAKCMNNYIKTTGSKLEAHPLLGIPLEELCEKYIRNDIPVMVWATTYMDEPYVFANWYVDYIDDDTTTKLGDTMTWQMHEHCMVLIGFDDKNYYFCDSVSGKVSAYDKATSEERYAQIGTQAIILK